MCACVDAVEEVCVGCGVGVVSTVALTGFLIIECPCQNHHPTRADARLS